MSVEQIRQHQAVEGLWHSYELGLMTLREVEDAISELDKEWIA